MVMIVDLPHILELAPVSKYRMEQNNRLADCSSRDNHGHVSCCQDSHLNWQATPHNTLYKMPPTRPDCFLCLTTTTPHNPHPLFPISPPSIYSCWPKYRFDHCCPALMLFLPLFDTERRHSSKMIVVKNLLVSRRFLGYWMHPTLRFITGVAQCHRIRRTLAPSSRRVSSPRHVPSPRRVLFGPPCAFCLILSVFRNLHFGIDIALNSIETLIIKPGTFGYNFGIAVHCTANRLGPLRYLSVDFISPRTFLLNLSASSTRSSNQLKPPLYPLTVNVN